MIKGFYEKHLHEDKNFPFILNNAFSVHGEGFPAHWHESIELLYFTKGKGVVNVGSESFEVGEGDLVLINSNLVHNLSGEYHHYCLIVNKDECLKFGIDVETKRAITLIRDEKMRNLFLEIIYEFENKPPYYKAMAKSKIMLLIATLYREHSEAGNIGTLKISTKKTETVKRIVKYINKNYLSPISTEDISKNTGYSKYYLCHVFKDGTGYSITDYVNMLRCADARNMLRSGNYNVGEVAQLCGFENMSYFTKIYKKYIGILPSKETKV